jgi:flagellar basal-body rod protein FlgB
MNSLDAVFNFHQTALKLREQRQEVLAANIANADTPNYKAKDFDFSSALKSAINSSQSNTLGKSGGNSLLTPSQTSTLHLANLNNKADSTNPTPNVQYRKNVQANIDNNTVDGDAERNAFVDNALRYETSLTVLHSQIKDLLNVIQG